MKPRSKYRIAFYAPLKPPDHPIASGDRQMARMLLSALGKCGYDAFLASRYIAYSKRYQPEYLEEKKRGAQQEAERLLRQWGEEGGAPDLWFCYHPYDKSPDWLGQIICKTLDIPMVTAEACKTGQGPNGEWVPWRQEAQNGIKQAALNFVMTPSDLDYMSGFVPPERIERLAPFIDVDLLVSAPPPADVWGESGEIRLLAVGMTRPGAKAQSYEVLYKALAVLGDRNWQLVAAGEGPERERLETEFAKLGGDRCRFVGQVSPPQVLGLMEQADILAWPGCREAYGMVYLEAASRGLPSVALDNMGVPLVVVQEQTGLLADPTDTDGYAAQLGRLLDDGALRKKLGAGARKFVLEERSAAAAARVLGNALDPLLNDKEQIR